MYQYNGFGKAIYSWEQTDRSAFGCLLLVGILVNHEIGALHNTQMQQKHTCLWNL